MPSIISHTATSLAFGSWMRKNLGGPGVWVLGALCTWAPDADVLMFSFGFSYGHFLGHRGFFHSFVFALLLALFIRAIFFPKVSYKSSRSGWLILFFFLCTASHGVLDCMTTGGKGVALLAPFDNTRYFFPEAFRVVKVSPLGIKRFFSEWGLRVLLSEFIWIWIPWGLVALTGRLLMRGKSASADQ